MGKVFQHNHDGIPHITRCGFTPAGKEVNHAQRWIEVGGINIMPSEIAKVAIIFYMASTMEEKQA